MGRYALLIIVSFFIATSCNDDSNDDLGDPMLFEWLVGEESASVAMDFNVQNSPGFEVTAEINGLCPSTGVIMRVDREGESLLDSFIVDFPAAFSFDIEGAKEIRVETEIQSIQDSEIDCVRLGNAKISGSY